ncbi:MULTISPECIES: hypothetical protein [unclassified Sphingomonas]|jgi:hypothetical protein|nr:MULTISPECIES: hypothetical protein [unclassified Sphingomonas]AXJ95106.1 hypothetical protein DM480_05870 [Sphingomonas sp. FARSPH]
MNDVEFAAIDERDAPAEASTTFQRRRKWPWIVGFALLVISALVAWNVVLYRPVANALAGEQDVSMVAYRRWLVSPGTLVIDVRDVKGTASMADMDRNLFKAAEALKDRRFDTVVLAYHGTPKWVMDADAFQTIGRERAFQNPVYVMRTMQQDVKNLDGTSAFPALYGGWLGVLGEELDQHKHFHEGWWLTPALGDAGAGL